MAPECYSQLTFGFQRKLRVDFAGGAITSDAGLVLVREFDERRGLTAAVAARVEDRRDRRYATHAVRTLVRQRLYQIAAGYEDVNDATRLREDPTLQLVAGDGRTVLASQPTLSRLENAWDWPTIGRLTELGVEWFCQHAYGPRQQPRELILDVDSTDDPVHGHQQLAFFTGHYGQVMYHPLVWTEGHTGLPLRTRLRPGRGAPAAGVVEDLRAMLPRLRRRFRRATLRLRGDAGMATPQVEATAEAAGLEYVLGIGPNKVFTQRIARLVTRATARAARTGRPVAIRTSFWHRATRWPRRRRILVKLDVRPYGHVVRYLVTNQRGRAADLIAWHEQRGDAENRIKELKQDLHADRLSCQRYRANAARLQLHTLAWAMLAYFRRGALAPTALARATVASLRVRLFKIGARVVRTARRIWLHLASGWPGQALFTHIHAQLPAPVP